MREKAQNSLDKLKKMRTRRKYVTISNDIQSSWHKCSYSPVASKPKVMEWANSKCIGQYSRDFDSYYFENEKDAFAFTLKWGAK